MATSYGNVQPTLIPAAPVSIAHIPTALRSQQQSSASYDGSEYGTSYESYKDSIVDHLSVTDDQGYTSPKSVPRSPLSLSPTKAFDQADTFGSRFLNTLSDNLKVAPAVAATASSLSRTGSLHARARSLAGFVPSLAASPESEHSVAMSGAQLARSASRRLGGLLSRGQAQRQNSMPEDEEPEETELIMDYKPTFTATPERRLSRTMSTRAAAAVSNNSTPTRPPTQQAKSSRLSGWFTQKVETPTSNENPTKAMELADPFLDLNINAALFPNGPADPLSPTAFNDLLQNATNLITSLQTSYRQKVTLLRSAHGERDAVVEESDEAATRAQHLKAQLEAMAQRAAEQDAAMQALANELAAERAARADDRAELDCLRRSAASGLDEKRRDSVSSHRHEPGNECNECRDESTPRRPRLGRSRRSDGPSSDSGFESDFDAETASVVSSACSPRAAFAAKPAMSFVAEEQGGERRTISNAGTNGAWLVVSQLRQENSGLKTRVGELERAVEGALRVVGRAV
ncbi:hypothetical protein MBLNU457_g0849t1 [Dothideomycetes sp. NU457]